MTQRKMCTKCGRLKTRDDFNRNKAAWDGLQNWCRACSAKNAARWSREHRAQVNQTRRRLYKFEAALRDSKRIGLIRQDITAAEMRRELGLSDNAQPAPAAPKIPDRACNVCGVVKPISAFARSKTSPDGHKHVCYVCLKRKRRKTRDLKLNRKMRKCCTKHPEQEKPT